MLDLKEPEDVPGFLLYLHVLRLHDLRAKPDIPYPLSRLGFWREHQVVKNGHLRKGAGYLKRPHHAALRNLKWREIIGLPAFKDDLAATLRKAADKVEHRGLSRAVWTDQSHDRSCLDRKRASINRSYAAEMFPQVLHREYVHLITGDL